MKEFFIPKTFRDETVNIIQIANEICENYAGQGYDLSLRQLYYQFVSKGHLENTEANYKKLGTIISDARLAGLIDWDHIKDRGRETIENPHWDSPGDIIQTCAAQYRIDLWQDQFYFVIVMVEKQALEGVLVPVCKQLDVTFVANKGYSSSSMMYEIGKRIKEEAEDARKPIVIYLGDHDPSGIDMTRDVFDRLNLLSHHNVEVIRVALNMDQIEQYNPPENPAKLTDTRAKSYIDKFGDSSWELDALDPSVLAELVRQEVLKYRNEKFYKIRVEQMKEEREELLKIAENY